MRLRINCGWNVPEHTKREMHRRWRKLLRWLDVPLGDDESCGPIAMRAYPMSVEGTLTERTIDLDLRAIDINAPGRSPEKVLTGLAWVVAALGDRIPTYATVYPDDGPKIEDPECLRETHYVESEPEWAKSLPA